MALLIISAVSICRADVSELYLPPHHGGGHSGGHEQGAAATPSKQYLAPSSEYSGYQGAASSPSHFSGPASISHGYDGSQSVSYGQVAASAPGVFSHVQENTQSSGYGREATAASSPAVVTHVHNGGHSVVYLGIGSGQGHEHSASSQSNQYAAAPAYGHNAGHSGHEHGYSGQSSQYAAPSAHGHVGHEHAASSHSHDHNAGQSAHYSAPASPSHDQAQYAQQASVAHVQYAAPSGISLQTAAAPGVQFVAPAVYAQPPVGAYTTVNYLVPAVSILSPGQSQAHGVAAASANPQPGSAIHLAGAQYSSNNGNVQYGSNGGYLRKK